MYVLYSANTVLLATYLACGACADIVVKVIHPPIGVCSVHVYKPLIFSLCKHEGDALRKRDVQVSQTANAKGLSFTRIRLNW